MRQILTITLCCIATHFSFACSSSLVLNSVTEVGPDFVIDLTINIGGGVTGATTGGANDTETFAIALRTPGDVPINASNVTPSLTGEETGTVNSLTLITNAFDAQLVLGYISPGTPFECVSSTAACGAVNVSSYNVTFTVDVLPEEIELYGAEGAGNPFGGPCPGTPAMIIPASALPVELVDFQATPINQSEVFLTWATASETGNWGFSVERKTAISDWQEIAFAEGKGESEILNRYSVKDENPESGINYYRIKQIDFDGRYAYSNVIKAEVTNHFNVEIFPNPVQDLIYLSGQDLPDYKFEFFRTDGSRVILPKLGTLQYDTSALQPGLYFVEISNQNTRQTLRFVKH